jgi:hypothetical protein
MKKVIAAFVIAFIATEGGGAQEVALPGASGSLKFAVIGDNGNGDPEEYDVGRQMASARQRFPFELVLMLGDNMLGRQQPADFVAKFERPYAPLLDAGVRFYAALGNHDAQSNRFYEKFNMGGERYYTYAKQNVRFFVLDSNLMDRKQLAWLETALKDSYDEWKIVYFHHPLYSNGGRHGSDVQLRVLLEPLLVRYGVDVVFSSHDHVYERLTPQKGIAYFIEGSSGQLRKGDLKRSATTAAGFDQDQTFMLVEIDGRKLSFQAISRTGAIVDSGVIRLTGTT